MMKNLLEKEQIKWFDEVNGMIMTDDIDSLFSCSVLKIFKNWEVVGFYDFDNLYLNWMDILFEDLVGIDMAMTSGKCIDNHVVKLSKHDNYNKESINLNLIEDIRRDNYGKKYCMSTLLEVLSLCGFTNEQMEKLSEEQKMFFLSVDIGYKGYYAGYKQTNVYYLKKLGYPCLIDVEARHTKEDFDKIVDKYKLYAKAGKIEMRGNKLFANNLKIKEINELFADTIFHIGLSDEDFQLEVQFRRNMGSTRIMRPNMKFTDLHCSERIYTLALNYRDSYVATYKKKETVA